MPQIAGETISYLNDSDVSDLWMTPDIGTIDVLHVDDEPDFASLAAEFVQRQDDRINVDTVTSASEALTRLRANTIDCVVSDHDMPGKNGIEFLETVREDHPDLPFILFTGKGSEEIASQAISAGVTEYLQKGNGTSQYAVLANRITNAVAQYRASQAFEESQKRLSLFIDQSPLGVIEWDESFHVQRMNEAAEEILGYSESDVVGRSWETFVPESDHEQVAQVFSNLLDGPGGYHSINENVRKDGERITCEWHNRTVAEADDSVMAIFSQIQDITHRKERERKLARQRAILKAQRDSVLNGQLLVDEGGQIVSYNEQFVEMWDIPEEIIERRDDAATLDFVTSQLANPQEFREKVQHLYDHIEERARDEIELADGRVFDRYTTPLFGDDQTYFGRLWTFRDITDRKERERELKRHRDLLEHTEQLAATGGWEADVQTGHQRWTDGTYTIHDLDPDGDFDPTVDAGVNFYHPDDQATIDQAVNRCMKRGESYEVELRLLTAENTLRWVRASGDAIEEDGDIVKIRGAIQDINDLKSREQELERQNDRLDDFVNIVSHDLRNPLSVARGRLERARTGSDPSDFDAVARAHDRMEELIEELLELARAGSDAPDLQEVKLDRVVEGCSRHLDAPDSTDITVEDLTLRADRKQLDFLVGNLLGNALEHGGHEVTITVGRLSNGWYIEDDGPGIPESDRQKVFESGFTTKTDGTGFGLDIVNRVVQAHGWSIRVTTSESGGARFEITGIEFPD